MTMSSRPGSSAQLLDIAVHDPCSALARMADVFVRVMSALVAPALVLVLASHAAADPQPAATVTPSPPPPVIKLGAWVEVYGQYNLRDPSNDVTNLRAFDARHGTLALQNAVLDATWTKGALSGRLALQFGDVGDLYYAGEPAHAAIGSAPASGATEWRHVQEAWAAWAAPDQVELAAGLFLSPVGPETPSTRDQWNWSRSDLFFALPTYHLGVRVRRPLGDTGWTLMAMIANGWNSVVDDNHDKSIAVAGAYQKGDWLAQVLYFGGVERPSGAPEGSPWRHLGDAYVQGPLGGGFAFMVHADAGVESGELGTSSWVGGAGYLKYAVSPSVFVAARGDALRESRASGASPILIPVSWLASGTATVSWRPEDGLDLRLEYRHDQAASDAYYGGTVPLDPATGLALPNRRTQDTITAGAIAWF
jgi:hypothetical protein